MKILQHLLLLFLYGFIFSIHSTNYHILNQKQEGEIMILSTHSCVLTTRTVFYDSSSHKCCCCNQMLFVLSVKEYL